jgi:hypothetical protein
MHKLTLERLVLGFWILGGGSIAACGLGTSGTAPIAGDASVDGGKDTGALDETVIEAATDGTVPMEDAVTPIEATTDAPLETSVGDTGPDGPTCTAANCGGACCGNTCLPSRSCATCASGQSFCAYNSTVLNSNGQCMASCSACTSGSAACFTCSGATGSGGTCVNSVDQCPKSVANGGCPCSMADAGTCPGSAQVCAAADAGNVCLSCGQPGTQGLACSGGSDCNQASSICGM